MRRASALALVMLATLAGAAGCRSTMSDRTLLDRTWRSYRTTFVTPDGRVVRPEDGGDSVSEGQAYALLRAAWMGDQATFDRVRAWTRRHLLRTGREAPSLMAWKWGPGEASGVSDWNFATDADVDYAFALLLASHRFAPTSAPPYSEEARAVLADILDHAVAADEEGRLVLLPGAWAAGAGSDGLVLNPSYFWPAAYRVFYETTGDPRWLRLASSSYVVLERVCGTGARPSAVPDWITWRSSTTWLPSSPAKSSWDAVRVPWRVATDVVWFDHADAKRFLARCLEPIVRQHLHDHGGMAAELSLDGEALGGTNHSLANALYAFALPEGDARRRLLAQVRTVEGPARGLFFDRSDRYYVNSLAYLPFLARAGGLVPPARR